MKNRKNILKALSCFLIATFVLYCGIGAISVNAMEVITSDSSIKQTILRSNSTFASKNLITKTEEYYNLYHNGLAIDLSEEAEIAALNNDTITSKSDAPYFPNSQMSTVQPKSVIGSDERTRVYNTTTYPYSAVCHLDITWPDKTTTEGTAWMYWENIAITAGHCVYSSQHGGWAESIVVRPAANGVSVPYGTTYATSLHTATKWIDDSNWEYDYGVLELSNDIGNYTGWFGTSWTIWTLWNADITITGYPEEYEREMWTMSGKVTTSATRKIYYEIDTTEGQSGAPVYKTDNHVIAIHTYGSQSENSGTRITSGIFDFFHSFREQ